MDVEFFIIGLALKIERTIQEATWIFFVAGLIRQ